jgi:very-short-patch-repair endonuclease
MSTNKAHVSQIFEYLLALKNLSVPVVRDLADYNERLWWQSDLPLADGCSLRGSCVTPDAWLEVRKQNVPPAPQPLALLKEWVLEPESEPDKAPAHHAVISLLTPTETREYQTLSARVASLRKETGNAPEQNLFPDTSEDGDELSRLEERLRFLEPRREVAFDADPRRVALWREWVEETWKPWAQVAMPLKKVERLYGHLFTLYQRLQREAETVELVWGHGLLVWKKDGLSIRRHVFGTRMELTFDVLRGVFTLTPADIGTQLETDMLTGINLPNVEHMVGLERDVQELVIDPWDAEIVNPLLNRLANVIDERGRTDLDRLVGGGRQSYEGYPVIYNAPAIFLRSSSGRQWQKDLRDILNAIREGCHVPESIEGLVDVDQAPPSEQEQAAWSPIGEDLLFPLPANEEQKEIVRRLARNHGVTVQGPPGTGKSHTIVNLVAHLLAHGKRVLVTSQTERALRVLGDMIDRKMPGIAPLCVSVLGGDARSTKELEESISRISEQLTSLSPELLERRIAELRRELYETRNQIARARTALGRATEAEHASVAFNDREQTPAEVATWISMYRDIHGWFPDNPMPEDAPPLDEAEVVELHRLLGTLAEDDQASLRQHRPSPEQLPTSAALRQQLDRLAQCESGAVERAAILRSWTLPAEAPSNLSDCVRLADEACRHLEPLTGGWLRHVLNDAARNAEGAEGWRELVDDCRRRIQSIRAAERGLAELNVEVPPPADPQQFKEDLRVLREEFAKGGGLGFWFRNWGGKHTLYVVEQCRVNGSAPRTAEDIDVLLKHVETTDARERLVTKWNNSVRDAEGPQLTAAKSRLLQTLEEHLELVEVALSWKTTHLQPLIQATWGIRPPGHQSYNDPEWLRSFRAGLQAYYDYSSEQAERERLGRLAQYLEDGARAENAHPLWSRLLVALTNRDDAVWGLERDEVARLASLEGQFDVLNGLRGRLRKVAPRWLSDVEAYARAGGLPEPPADWLLAWEWKRADAWLGRHLENTRTEELYRALDEAIRAEARLIAELVAQNTWLGQLRRITSVQKRSLHAWLQAIRRIGKGTGKYADKHRADAKREMAVCRGAVPVWIMPLGRVIENLHAAGDRFDVVIVDESSQCDLFALNALFRAERAVIVGDDKQISPEGVGREQTEVNMLIERHLVGVPQRARFTLQDSLYDMGLRVFPGHLMLKEHFRCVPEIIQWSNDMFYGGEINPLRLPSLNERLEPAVKAVRVDEGRRDEGTKDYNEPEARALVERVVDLCGREEYSGRTMGVISLLGKDQAFLIEQLLREQLGEQEMVERTLVCGDAYSFQGDERDVMFLSMVSAPNVRSGVLNKTSDRQRFNVAASRSRDQMWLFHSVDLKDLNPECMRSHLLRYCLDPQRTQASMVEVEAIFDRYGSSEFHKEVHRLITARGYRAVPEYKVGTHPYRIDTVIEGLHSRLAVECDGDRWHGLDRWEADLERQQVLERAGWKFWRLRASVFYRDRDKAMEPLWQLLEAMKIYPAGFELQPAR